MKKLNSSLKSLVCSNPHLLISPVQFLKNLCPISYAVLHKKGEGDYANAYRFSPLLVINEITQLSDCCFSFLLLQRALA